MSNSEKSIKGIGRVYTLAIISMIRKGEEPIYKESFVTNGFMRIMVEMLIVHYGLMGTFLIKVSVK